MHHNTIAPLMTGLGHSRRSDGQQGFAECPLCLQWRPNWVRRNEPTRSANCGRERLQQLELLFDHLVGAGK